MITANNSQIQRLLEPQAKVEEGEGDHAQKLARSLLSVPPADERAALPSVTDLSDGTVVVDLRSVK